jgi:hypothetical protein
LFLLLNFLLVAERNTIFAKLTPTQKSDIVRALRGGASKADTNLLANMRKKTKAQETPANAPASSSSSASGSASAAASNPAASSRHVVGFMGDGVNVSSREESPEENCSAFFLYYWCFLLLSPVVVSTSVAVILCASCCSVLSFSCTGCCRAT